MNHSDVAFDAHVVIAAAPDHISTELSGEVVILHMARGIYYSLDEVGARVWALIQQPQSIGAVRDQLLDEYDVEPDECERALAALVQQLADESLIEVRDAATEHVATPSHG